MSDPFGHEKFEAAPVSSAVVSVDSAPFLCPPAPSAPKKPGSGDRDAFLLALCRWCTAYVRSQMSYFFFLSLGLGLLINRPRALQ